MITPELLPFALKSAGLTAAFYLWYLAFLRRNPRFSLIRVYLLAALGLPLIFPLFRLELFANPVETTASLWLETIQIGANPNLSANNSGSWLLFVYLLGAGLLALLFGWRMARLIYWISRSEREKFQGYTLIRTHGKVPTSSFLNYLFWDEKFELSSPQSQQLLAHELCHMRQFHSLDLLFAEMLKVVFWFNPFIWLLQKELKQNHEYLADQAALAAGQKENYAALLLHSILPAPSFVLSHSFFQPQIKNRIIMMNKKKSSRHLLGFLTVLPLAGILFLTTSCTAPTADAADLTNLPTGQHDPETKAKTDADSPDAASFAELDQQPQPLNLSEVVTSNGYPEAAKKAEIEGKVILRVKVDQEGNYAEHEVLKDPHPFLTKHVESYVNQLKFSPGLKDGKAVTTWVTIPFQFKLPAQK
ncbi:MAG: M56 family metallopeptidase [Bacteroidia bacterium]|nr:M56 family metallopeptidase [Bacteroidia bacterium]